MLCEICEAEDVIFTLIPTREGMPQSIGAGCFARMGLEFAKAALPAEEIAERLGPMFVTPGRTEALKGERKRKTDKAEAPAPVEEAPEGQTGGPAEEPAAAANE